MSLKKCRIIKREGDRKMEQKDMDRVQEIVSELAPDLKELTLKIHDNPELGNQEH